MCSRREREIDIEFAGRTLKDDTKSAVKDDMWSFAQP